MKAVSVSKAETGKVTLGGEMEKGFAGKAEPSWPSRHTRARVERVP